MLIFLPGKLFSCRYNDFPMNCRLSRQENTFLLGTTLLPTGKPRYRQEKRLSAGSLV